MQEPTLEQKTEFFRICYYLTQMYLPIYLLTVDQRTEDIVILAGVEMVVSINKQGDVEYE